jgi:hypothetical protein
MIPVTYGVRLPVILRCQAVNRDDSWTVGPHSRVLLIMGIECQAVIRDDRRQPRSLAHSTVPIAIHAPHTRHAVRRFCGSVREPTDFSS